MIEMKENRKSFTQKCVTQHCNQMLMVDEEFQENLSNQSNKIVLRGLTVVRINKLTGSIEVKCRKCKVWNNLKELKIKLEVFVKKVD